MEQSGPGQVDEELAMETPEDVAVLYSWAKLQGAKYRDFSASRREYRAQLRHRAAELQREAERRSQREAERAASAAEQAAREAEQAARLHEDAARLAAGTADKGELVAEEAARVRAVQAAAGLARKASRERVEAARRAEAVAAAEAATKREEREMAEAHASAERQAQKYEGSETRRRAAAGPQPTLAGRLSDPYDPFMEATERENQASIAGEDDMKPTRHQHSRERIPIVRPFESFGPERVQPGQEDDTRAKNSAIENAPLRFYKPRKAADAGSWSDEEGGRSEPRPDESRSRQDVREAYAAKVAAAPYASRVSSGVLRIPEALAAETAGDSQSRYERREQRMPWASVSRVEPRAAAQPEARQASEADEGEEQAVAQAAVPAWIYSQGPEPVVKRVPPVPAPPAVEDTLQHSRERVASRWFALKGVFDHKPEKTAPELEAESAQDTRVPLLTVFSLAGGVGKTSLVATLGRALSSVGERVLLTDTTSYGLLPFYFGASELRRGVVRTFSPPAGSADAPIHLVSYDVNDHASDVAAQDLFCEELMKNSRGMQRVLVDLAPGAAWVGRRLAGLNSTLLVPVTPDMNSVISLQGVEKFLGSLKDGAEQPVRPFYILNQFDASLPLHLDVREVMRQQLGDRLLPFAIRRSASVSEALAEGMTVMDYSPDSPVAADYLNIVSWVRSQAAPAAGGFRNARWSER